MFNTQYPGTRYKKVCLILIFIVACKFSFAQILNKTISLDVTRQRLDNVLEIMSNKGNFYFSYNSNIIKKDSLVTLTAGNKTVKQLLEQLLPDNYEFRESGNYIIIRKAPIKITFITNKAVTEDRHYLVSGYVLDAETVSGISNASVYEKTVLASSMTNDNGFFKIKLKHKTKRASLTVSKELYEDTTVFIDPGFNQQITVTMSPVLFGTTTIIAPGDYIAPEQLKLRVQRDSTVTEYTYTKTDSVKVERSGLGKWLISSQQKLHSINLKNFFTTRPYQVSLTPKLSTHGQLAPQVINNFSLNVFGGYNGGVKGIEIGGLFNIDKKNVEFMQVAGLFNVVGGYVKGLQIAGISNTVLDTVYGFQVAGISNIVKGKFAGFQLGGIYNHVSDSVKGFQLAGIANFAKKKVTGSQIAGIANISNREVTGVQVSGIVNYAKRVKGLQVGLINIADTSEGFSVGLINIILKGYHKLAVSTDEVVNFNVAFKTGSNKLYSILQSGLNVGDSNKVFTVGYGIGTRIGLGKTFSLHPELTGQYLYLGSWDYTNILSKFHLDLNVRLNKYISFYAGPVFNVYTSKQNIGFTGYRSVVPPAGYHTYNLGTNVKGWLGWSAGINFF